jgi:hypothetical protein
LVLVAALLVSPAATNIYCHFAAIVKVHYHLLHLLQPFTPQKSRNQHKQINQKMGSAGETQMTPTQVDSDEEANLFSMQLASASVIPMILKSAIELDLLEIMAKAGPGAYLSPSEIASQLPTTNPDAPATSYARPYLAAPGQLLCSHLLSAHTP